MSLKRYLLLFHGSLLVAEKSLIFATYGSSEGWFLLCFPVVLSFSLFFV